MIVAIVGIVMLVALAAVVLLARKVVTSAPSQEQIIHAALTRLLRRSNGPFVIIEDPRTGKFVQFAGSADEPLLLDFPADTLSPEEMARAKALFAERGYPVGPSAGALTSFNVTFDQDVHKAAAFAVAILQRVYGLDAQAKLKLTEE